MPSMPDVIAHYQRSIEKSGKEPDRLLHCLDKLFKLDVTVQHLQDTGVGRTVNTLRKYSGDVGEAAKALVAKWKTMVTAHESGPESGNTSNDDEEYLDRLEHSTSSDPSPSKQHHPHKSASKASSTAATSHSQPHSGHSHSNGNSGGDAGGSTSAKQSASHSRTSHSSSSSSNKTNSNATSSSGRHEKREASGSSRSRTPHEKSTHHKSSRHNAADTGAVSMPTQSTSSGSSSNNKRKADDASASRRPKEPKLAINGGGVSDKKKSETVQEIDSSMGTSFADALGMMTPNKKSTASSKLKSSAASSAPHSNSRTVAVPSTSSASSSSSSSSPLIQPSTSKSSASPKPVVYKKPTAPPTLLTSAAKLAPLDPAIAVAISNDYRPLPPNPIIMECVYKGSALPTASVVPKTMSDAELGASMSSKSMRTKVYSGVKTGALLNVPSLYELCIRVLQRNIEGLEATGGVPFEILQPVLERTTPEQLFTLEDFNPYLMDDTGDLWMKHCSRKFRGQKPREFESWRDMFLRCREEQELRLSHLTENIKRTQTVAVPVKQTKITFVDTAVKPPRDVLKKQARFGTERVPVCTPAARVASLNHATSNLARPGDARLRVMAGMRDNAQVNNARVAKKAPLMQKTLQHMKGLFKR